MVSGLLVKDGAGSWCVEEPGRAAAVADLLWSEPEATKVAPQRTKKRTF
jgi:hypothetical protein